MPDIAPFRALVYDTSVAGPLERLTTPPYDVIRDDRRAGYLEREPRNVAHVDLPDAVGSGGDPYHAAAAKLSSWREEGALRLTTPSHFAYEMAFTWEGEHRRLRGLMTSLRLEAWGGRVLPHEDVMEGPVEDRLQLLRATRTHLSPIYGTIEGPCPSLAMALERAAAGRPPLEVVDREDVRHRVWPLDDDGALGAALHDETLLIADGHHRYTTALAYREERRASEGSGPWDRTLALIVDAATESVPVLPYHRIQLGGDPPPPGDRVIDLEHALAALDDRGLVYATVTRTDDGLRFTLHRLHGRPPTVGALHEQHLDAAAPGELLTFTHHATEAVDAVRTGGATAAYLLPSTTPDRIVATVRAGHRLPRKSTFFWPKPRTGLLMLPLDDQTADHDQLAPTPAPTPPSS